MKLLKLDLGMTSLKEAVDEINLQVKKLDTKNEIQDLPPPANTLEELGALVRCDGIVTDLRVRESKTLPDTIRNMVRRLLSRQLALTFSFTGMGPKKKYTKIKFEGSLAERVLIKALQHTKYRGIDKCDLDTAISQVLRGASDWDGMRKHEKKLGECLLVAN